MQEASGKMPRHSPKFDLMIAMGLTVVGALARIPYLALIPRFADEVMQTVYALTIRPGHFLPLVGNDPYAGPMFSYILAACLRLFGASPEAPRIVVMIMGALTVGLTFLLARALGLSRPWAVLAGLMLAANPLHILVNSHYAGTTYVLPLFSTAFLLALALAVKRAPGGHDWRSQSSRQSGLWLIAAGVLLGLAMQANPVPALMLPGVVVWFLIQHTPRIGLRTPWPYLAVAAAVLAYAPVIVYNVQNGLLGVAIVENKQTYVWQPASSVPVAMQNLVWLGLQLFHQVSGVIEGDPASVSLIGLPMVMSAWAVAGMVYAARAQRDLSLTTLAVGSQVLIMPWLSQHYGEMGATRFTNQLTPLIFVAMCGLAAEAWSFIRARLSSPAVASAMTYAAGVLFVAISLWPLITLFGYYDRQIAAGQTNRYELAFFRELARQWKGETILVSDTLGRFNATEYFLAVNDVPYTHLPIGRLLERLSTRQETGRIIVALDDSDLPRAGSQADLIPWRPPGLQPEREMGYGLYVIAEAQTVRKPTFVFSDTTLAPTVHPLQVSLDEQISLIGYEPKSSKVAPGDQLIVQLYWKANGASPDDYMGFIHLLGPDGQLVAQDDHELGRGFYRAYFWQPDEIVRERYELVLPNDAPRGDYSFRAGVYRFPSLERLGVRSANVPAQDNTVTFGTLHVGP
jgi:4-amino-4-deoxy-L-arabinose transferase-like glycosyltransferase